MRAALTLSALMLLAGSGCITHGRSHDAISLFPTAARRPLPVGPASVGEVANTRPDAHPTSRPDEAATPRPEKSHTSAPGSDANADSKPEHDDTTLLVDLPSVLMLAGANDLLIESSRELVVQRQAEQDLGRTRYLPELVPFAGADFHRGSLQSTRGRFLDVTRQQTQAGVALRLELELGEALFQQGAAEQRSAASRHALDQTIHARLLEAAAGYWNLVATEQGLSIARQARDFAEQLLSYEESRLRNGVGLELDVARARARREAEDIALGRAELSWRTASVQLGRSLRLAPAIQLLPAATALQLLDLGLPQRPLDELVSEALAHNPGLLAALDELHATEAEARIESEGWAIPDLFVSLGTDLRGDNLGDLDSARDAGVGLSWSIPFGQRDKTRVADARRNQAAIELSRQREELVAEVTLLVDRIRLDARAVAASGRRIEAASDALELAQARLRAGSGLLLDVFDARTELTAAQLSRLAAITESNKSQVTLLVALGANPLDAADRP